MIRSRLAKLRRRFGPTRPFPIATEKDLYYCYRLLLQREPDETGWRHYLALINHHGVTTQWLVANFLTSEEFVRLQEEIYRPQLVELDTFKLYARPNDFLSGAAIIQQKQYEPHVTAELRRLLQPGMVLVDLGANVGYFTLLAATLVGPQGKVIAFEPNPETCVLLRQSIAVNGLSQVELHPYAAAEKAQTFTLEAPGGGSNGRIVEFSAEARARPSLFTQIEAVALDDFLAAESRIDVIKMDIEGAEARAVQGMGQLIRRHRPVLLLEFSPSLLEMTSHVSPESFLDALLAHQYDLFILEGTNRKSASPQTKAAILEAARQPARSHLDLVAYPQAF
jgi:FkbM family methyltransferase